jgi:hypothetical protein
MVSNFRIALLWRYQGRVREGVSPAILILAAFCQPIVIIFHEIAIYCADRGQNENCWGVTAELVFYYMLLYLNIQILKARSRS